MLRQLKRKWGLIMDCRSCMFASARESCICMFCICNWCTSWSSLILSCSSFICSLMVCAMDRFGMAESLDKFGAKVTYGDMIFTLDIDQPVTNLDELAERADKLLPDICKMPISMVYPTGSKQNSIEPTPMTDKYYRDAEIIAGDFLFIRRRMPERLDGKIIITNTVTSANVEELKERGVSCLVTTTPEFSGRSFGTNVMEAVMISMLGKKWDDVTPQDYLDLIKRLNFRPRIVKF